MYTCAIQCDLAFSESELKMAVYYNHVMYERQNVRTQPHTYIIKHRCVHPESKISSHVSMCHMKQWDTRFAGILSRKFIFRHDGKRPNCLVAY